MYSLLLLVVFLHIVGIQITIEVNLHLLLLACKAESLNTNGSVKNDGIRGVLLDNP